jgi:hypothetical protein
MGFIKRPTISLTNMQLRPHTCHAPPHDKMEPNTPFWFFLGTLFGDAGHGPYFSQMVSQAMVFCGIH